VSTTTEPQAIVYFCGDRVLAHSCVEDQTLAAAAEACRREGINYLVDLVARKGDTIQPHLLRALADLLEHSVQSCRVSAVSFPGYLVRSVGGKHGLPIVHPQNLAKEGV
jgi:hypothetical protein